VEPNELGPSCRPERALGVCFTGPGHVVLVSGDGRGHWNHPGGGVETGETATDALCREVYEEACARVVRSKLVGYERMVEIDGDGTVGRVHYQARFAAQVEVEPFVRRHEIGARTIVPLHEVPSHLLTWQPEALDRLLFRAASAFS